MSRVTFKELCNRAATFNSHHGLHLKVYKLGGHSVVYNNGVEIAYGSTAAETDRILKAWVRGWLAGLAHGARPQPAPAPPVKLKVQKATCQAGKDLVACGFTYGRKYTQARGTKFYGVKYRPGAMAKLRKLYGDRVLHIEKSFLQPESIVILKEAANG